MLTSNLRLLAAQVILAASIGFSLAKTAEERWWQYAPAMKTVSPSCSEMKGLTALRDDIIEGAENGVNVLAINAVYDSGSGVDYPAGTAYCGLAGKDHFKVNPMIGSESMLRQLVQFAHNLDVRVISWFNPSYIYTGSELFIEAEKDMGDVGGQYHLLSADSKARWFKWWDYPPCGNTAEKPDQPEQTGEKSWIWSETAQSHYLSIWANQPSLDFTVPEAVEYIQQALAYWVDDVGIDGFLFDNPDQYIGLGAEPVELCFDEISQTCGPCWDPGDLTGMRQFTYGNPYMKADMSKVVFMAELYGEDGASTNVVQYQFDVYIR